ncbi:MAG: cytochrome c biogenesis protein CcsA [Actinobacteria bacterium]|nr:cytochrome c biogenesis protein CcsA [Actinomycetota bacterium]
MTSIDTGLRAAPKTVDAPTPAPIGTGSRGSRILGVITLALTGLGVLYGLVISPPDANQSNAARLLYIHVPSAIVAYVAFGVTAFASIMVLWKKTETWDLIAASSAEIGIVFTMVCLATGMLWGRPIWGVFWTWDARLTTTALLLVLFVGYVALRRALAGNPNRAKWCAIAGIFAAIDVPIVHESTTWWVTLHQGQTVRLLGESQIGGTMLFSLLIMMVAGMCGYVWMLIIRFRVAFLAERVDETAFDAAIAERRSEAEKSRAVPTIATSEAQ